MASERVASGEIFIGLDDEAALAGLRRVEADFERAMARIDREEATVDLNADLEHLKRDLDKARAEVKKYEKFTESSENSRQRAARKRHLEKLRQTEQEAAAAVDAHRQYMRQRDQESRADAVAARRKAAEAKRDADRARVAEAAARKRLAAEKAAERQANLNQKAEERLNASRQRAEVLAARQERDVARLNRRYNEAAARIREYRKELDSLRLPRERRQRIELSEAEAIAEMKLIQTELNAMGRNPVHQKIALDVEESGISALERWSKAVTDTTVRIGPFTTTIAGLTRALLLLGPIVVGLVGQLAALVAVVGGGVAGAMGVAVGAVGAFAVSLGGVGLLLPSLLRDFKNLNTLQDAYHKQVLKTGANSDKAKKKLQEFNHALGEVTPTTRHAFEAYDKLQGRWRALRKEARPDFLNMLGSALDVVNKDFDWFGRNTLQAFHNIRKGWDDWMKGLRGGEATRILHQLGRDGNRSIQPLMSGLGHLGAAVGRIAASFARYLPGLLHGFDDWAAGIDNATTHTDRMHKRTALLIDAMKSVGRFTMAAARVITAFFLPGVDDGTNMVDKWATGLNALADRMQGRGRKGIDQWFKDSIVTANKFWQALKPLAQLFFEWSNIMRPFTNVALGFLKVLGDLLQMLLDFGPTKDALKIAFGIFLYGAAIKKVGAFRDGLASIYGIVKGLRAAGGISGALNAGKGGIIKFLTGGMAGRGSTPANPLFVMNVGGGGGVPGVGGKGGPVVGGGGAGGLISQLPRLVKFAGGAAALAGAMFAMTKWADKMGRQHGLEQWNARLEKMVSQRNLTGLVRERDTLVDMMKHGWNVKQSDINRVNAAIDAVNRLDKMDIHRLTGSMDQDYKRMSHESKVTFERISGLAEYHFNIIARTTKKGSFAAQQAASHNFNLAEKAIDRAMKQGTVSTKKGMALIEKLWEQALAQYGFSPHEARNIRKGLNPNGGPMEGTTGVGAGGKTRSGPVHRAQGGLMQVGRPGEVGPDSVPMNLGGVPSVVAPGEQIAVFNRHQQKKFAQTYPGGLPGFFSGPQRPHHYDVGGMIQAANRLDSQHFPYKWGGGHESAKVPLEPVDCSGAVSYVLQQGGVNIPSMVSGSLMNAGKPGPGVVTVFANPEHTFMRIGGRYFGTSQSNPGGGAGWMPAPSPAYLASFTQRHFDAGDFTGGFSDVIKAPIVEGLGVVGDVANAALQTAAAAATQNLRATAASFGGGGDANLPGASSPAQVKQWVIAGLKAAGQAASPASVSTLVSRAMQESTGDPGAVNNWDVNAKRGTPTKGLMQLLDSNFAKYHVAGTSNSIFDPVANVAAAIGYMLATYGHLVGANGHGYALGGLIDVMAPAQWARGGMVDRPTLMTGEDGKKHPEYVISTNPQFKKSNLAALADAASALGIPQARQGHNSKKGKGKHSELVGFMGSPVPKFIHGKGKDVGSLYYVKHYADLQQREDDTNRQISINASKVQEPDSFLKQTGTDAAGNPVYAIDETVIAKYEAQMQAVMDLWNKMLGKGGILDQLAVTAGKAYEQINGYISRRYANIDALNNTITIDKVLAKSKDDKTATRARNRLEKAQSMRSDEYGKIGDARDARKQIQDDQHDAYYRRQEYGIDQGSLRDDMAAVRAKAQGELDQSKPDTSTDTTDTGPSILEQTATYSQARADLLTQMGSNFDPTLGALAGAMGIGGGPVGSLVYGPGVGGAARVAVAQAGSAAGVFNGTSPLTTSSGATITPSGGQRHIMPVLPGHPFYGPDGTMVGMTNGGVGGGGQMVHVENINFPVAPTDPHTFSKNLVWELGALST